MAWRLTRQHLLFFQRIFHGPQQPFGRRAELRSDSDSTGTGESTDVERDDVAIASDIRPDHLLRGADGASDPIELDSSERSPMLDDAREQIDTLASDDDAAPGDATGQDAGNAEDGDSD